MRRLCLVESDQIAVRTGRIRMKMEKTKSDMEGKLQMMIWRNDIYAN